jgi:phosphatidylcholine synthase
MTRFGGEVPLTAWLVHIYTALGAVAALLATQAVFARDVRTVFLWLAAATFIDSTDGWFARLARVRERTPAFDGARLDDIVDYLTFVFVPVVLIVEMDLVPRALEVPIAAAVLLASGYGFANTDAKTDDYFFTGFPSYWNIVVFYFVALATGPTANAIVLAAFLALVFVRTGYLYPSRTPVLRGVTIALGSIWAVLVLAATWQLPTPSRPLVLLSLFFPIYYFMLSYYLQARRVTRKAPSPRPQAPGGRAR